MNSTSASLIVRTAGAGACEEADRLALAGAHAVTRSTESPSGAPCRRRAIIGAYSVRKLTVTGAADRWPTARRGHLWMLVRATPVGKSPHGRFYRA